MKKTEFLAHASEDMTCEVSDRIEQEYQELLRGMSGIARSDRETATGTGGDGDEKAVYGHN